MFNLFDIFTHYPDFRRRWLFLFVLLLVLKTFSMWQLIADWEISEEANLIDDNYAGPQRLTAFRIMLALLVAPERILGFFAKPVFYPSIHFALIFWLIILSLLQSLFLAYLVHVGKDHLFRYRNR